MIYLGTVKPEQGSYHFIESSFKSHNMATYGIILFSFSTLSQCIQPSVINQFPWSYAYISDLSYCIAVSYVHLKKMNRTVGDNDEGKKRWLKKYRLNNFSTICAFPQ